MDTFEPWAVRYAAGVSPEFLATTLIVVVTPGTGVLYTLAAGLSHGARASVGAAIGCTLGIVPHMLAAITGPLRCSIRARSHSMSSGTPAWLTCCTWRG